METSKPKGYEPAPIAEPLLTVDGPVTVEAPARRAHFRDAWAALLSVGPGSGSQGLGREAVGPQEA